MKKFSVLAALLLSFAACSSPLLRWIDAPMVPGISFGITDFAFEGVTSTKTIIADPAALGEGRTLPIAVTVPPGTDLGHLKPVVTYKGDFLTGPGIAGNRGDGPATKRAETTQDFTSPKDYRVTNTDGAGREYEVRVYIGDSLDSKQITGFYFTFPGSPLLAAEGIIDETAKTIAVTVPYGMNLANLTPEIYHTGDSVSPISGAPGDFNTPRIYTVRALNGTTQSYTVTVFVDADSAKEITAFGFHDLPRASAIIGGTPGPDGKIPLLVTVPSTTDITKLQPDITHTGDSVGGPGIISGGGPRVTGTAVDFTGPQSYTITAADGTTQEYTVTVIKASAPAPAGSTEALINAFYFESPLALGTINQSAGTIAVTVPYGTNLGTITPTIHYTGAKIAGGSAGETALVPAYLPADFSSAVPYTVTAQAGGAVKTYTVTVNAAPNRAKEITALSFAGFSDTENAGTSVIISSVPDSSGRYPIAVTVPNGKNLASLSPVITHTGASITGPGVPGNAGTVTGTPVNFTTPQTYTVKAADGSTRTYVISVRAADNNAKRITGFYFETPTAFGDIDEDNKKISVTVPYGTNLEALKPTVYFNGVSLSPVSGKENNFLSPRVYSVSAANGTIQPYEVTVKALQNSAKDITVFTLPGSTHTVIGSNPGQDGTYPIAVTVPENTVLSYLAPAITHTGKSIDFPSGSYRNFEKPVLYTVTAEDGSTKTYTVEVFRQSNNAKIITGFTFASVPAVNGVPVVGAVDQGEHTITVYVPANKSLNNLQARISFVGKSVTPPSGAVQTANPFTDTRNWTLGTVLDTAQTYRVTAPDNTYQDYKVTVKTEEQNSNLSVTFTGISDPSLISTGVKDGVLTVTVKAVAGYKAPYEWYLDGNKLAVSNTAPSLSLKLADLKAGKHELVLMVTGPAGFGSTGTSLFYTNKMYFTVND